MTPAFLHVFFPRKLGRSALVALAVTFCTGVAYSQPPMRYSGAMCSPWDGYHEETTLHRNGIRQTGEQEVVCSVPVAGLPNEGDISLTVVVVGKDVSCRLTSFSLFGETKLKTPYSKIDGLGMTVFSFDEILGGHVELICGMSNSKSSLRSFMVYQ